MKKIILWIAISALLFTANSTNSCIAEASPLAYHVHAYEGSTTVYTYETLDSVQHKKIMHTYSKCIYCDQRKEIQTPVTTLEKHTWNKTYIGKTDNGTIMYRAYCTHCGYETVHYQ